uniref:Uncharacterized protein n=1 Tax=viral metagenome TaxID=1070528 RepID=A0A6C0C048_9ZZZZ
MAVDSLNNPRAEKNIWRILSERVDDLETNVHSLAAKTEKSKDTASSTPKAAIKRSKPSATSAHSSKFEDGTLAKSKKTNKRATKTSKDVKSPTKTRSSPKKQSDKKNAKMRKKTKRPSKNKLK